MRLLPTIQDDLIRDSLVELAQRLLQSGPFKIHPAQPRRIRILFNKTYIADTTDALCVWEHPGYPYYYLPWAAFGDEGRSYIEDDEKSRAASSTDLVGKNNAQGEDGAEEKPVKGNEEGTEGTRRNWNFVKHVKDEGGHVGATIHELEVWDEEGVRRSTGPRIVEFARGELMGLLRVEFGAVGECESYYPLSFFVPRQVRMTLGRRQKHGQIRSPESFMLTIVCMSHRSMVRRRHTHSCPPQRPL